MPIIPSIPVTPISQEAFGKMAFELMRHVFVIHDEFGRFFDELIYKRELARRLDGLELEVSVEVIHQTFRKTYFADVIAARSGLFEFKAVDAIHARHRAQTTQYLLLFGLHHGKVINMRPDSVEHEFVNVLARLRDMLNPVIDESNYHIKSPGASWLKDIVLSVIHDWGAGLELALYEEAITHFLGGEANVLTKVPITGTGGELATQPMRLLTPETAFKVTTFSADSSHRTHFRTHTQRLLSHTPLRCIQWVNIHRNEITFTTIQ
jgi:GxxExxY protein